MNTSKLISILKVDYLSARSKYLFFKKSAQKQENQRFQAIADILKELPEPREILPARSIACF
jgi:hypothetical protein